MLLIDTLQMFKPANNVRFQGKKAKPEPSLEEIFQRIRPEDLGKIGSCLFRALEQGRFRVFVNAEKPLTVKDTQTLGKLGLKIDVREDNNPKELNLPKDCRDRTIYMGTLTTISKLDKIFRLEIIEYIDGSSEKKLL